MRPTKTLLSPLLGLVAAGMLAASTAEAKEFRSSDVHPLDYPTVQAVMYMGKLIGERTGGRHGVKVFGQSTLGSEKDTIEQTKIGALDMVRVNVAPFMMVRSADVFIRHVVQAAVAPWIFTDDARVSVAWVTESAAPAATVTVPPPAPPSPNASIVRVVATVGCVPAAAGMTTRSLDAGMPPPQVIQLPAVAQSLPPAPVQRHM